MTSQDVFVQLEAIGSEKTRADPKYGAGKKRFGVADRGGTMIITPTRQGDFYSAAEVARGVNPNWVTGMAY